MAVICYTIDMRFFKARKIDLTQEGLAKFLGTLEARILEQVWKQPNINTRQMCDQLNQEQEISFNAVQTVLGRLVEKGILKKKRSQGLWSYQATYDRATLYRYISSDVVESLLREKDLFGVAAFARLATKLSAEEKANLKKLLR